MVERDRARRCCRTLTDEQAALHAASELAYQNHVAASSAYAALPRGPVHADLFRDNVMFEGEELTGFFDFYFAGVDTWLFDLARVPERLVYRPAHRRHDAERATRMLDAYQTVRPLTAAERELLPAMRAPGRCGSGSRACGTSTCRARPPCSNPTTPRTSSACCAGAWPCPYTRLTPQQTGSL